MRKLIAYVLVFLITVQPVFAGTAYYVDLSAASNGDGSYGSPWNNIASINSHSFSTGDDIYFKVGTDEEVDTNLDIDWVGTSEDRVVIGAYYGNGQFGLNGGARPILDGAWTYPVGDYAGLVQVNKSSPGVNTYVTIKDLQFDRARWYSVELNFANYNIVENCYFKYNDIGQSIMVSFAKYNIIKGNEVQRTWYSQDSLGAAIEITGGDIEDSCLWNIVADNFIRRFNEGIGIYKMAKYTLVENNILEDGNNIGIYAGANSNTVARNNITYYSDNAIAYGGPSDGNGFDVEEFRSDPINGTACYTGPMLWIGNTVVNATRGFLIANTERNDDTDCHWTHTRIINETYIDCSTSNIRIGTGGSDAGQDVKILNCISTMPEAGGDLINSASPSGISFSHNLYDTDPGGNANDNAVIGVPGLTKTSGWDDIATLTFDEDWLELTGSGVNAANAGTYHTVVDATEPGTENTTVIVDDPYVFFPMSGYPSEYTVVQEIEIDNNNDGVVDIDASVTAVDHDTGVITLDAAYSYTAGGHIWAKRISTDWSGTAIDIGAKEFYEAEATPPATTHGIGAQKSIYGITKQLSTLGPSN